MAHAIDQLREKTLSSCTKPFKARGSIIKRCPQCLLAHFACLCPWQLTRHTDIQFVIVIHRKELYKSTNTGRLIADLFPDSTSAYLWSRTEPEATLLEAINNAARRVVLLFPENKASDLTFSPKKKDEQTDFDDDRPMTVILLDGTWKQAARMANLSPWLQHIPRLNIKPNIGLTAKQEENPQTYIRKAQHDYQISTAQAAACVLKEHEDIENALLLEHYFSIFNQHCIATRRNITPELSRSHLALTKAKHNDSTN